MSNKSRRRYAHDLLVRRICFPVDRELFVWQSDLYSGSNEWLTGGGCTWREIPTKEVFLGDLKVTPYASYSLNTPWDGYRFIRLLSRNLETTMMVSPNDTIIYAVADLQNSYSLEGKFFLFDEEELSILTVVASLTDSNYGKMLSNIELGDNHPDYITSEARF